MFCVRFAGVLIAIENRYPFVERLCADYLADASPDACDFTVSVTPEEIAAENDGEQGEFSPAYCESLALYRKICARMLDYDAFLFHAAIVSYEGRGFAFTAKSGTGKSTHVAQWTRALGDRVTVINGDKPILRWKEGQGDAEGRRAGAFIAYGTPYNGKEGWGKTRASLFAPSASSSAASRGGRSPAPAGGRRADRRANHEPDPFAQRPRLGLPPAGLAE